MMLVHEHATTIIRRLAALLAVLRNGPCSFDRLYRSMEDVFDGVAKESARRMINRDLAHLASLGIRVERQKRTYILRGGMPVFDKAELHALALIRDTFDERHPQAVQVSRLLQRLTEQLTEAEQRIYQRRVSRQAMVRPAIDYAPFAPIIEQLEKAIAARQPVSFVYENSRKIRRSHRYVEPYDIEFYDRHFYLVAYSERGKRVLDFRINRISDLRLLDQRLPPGTERRRHLITFRYRLTGPWVQDEISERFDEQQVIERHPDSLVIEAKGRSEFFIIQTLLRYRSHAELLHPPELRRQMMEEVRRLAEMYGVVGQGDGSSSGGVGDGGMV
ncbi:MAG: WYL domain-containing protein [Chloroflexus sp.]|nr:WYL domain-containing protein [Chloroflexus sp.]